MTFGPLLAKKNPSRGVLYLPFRRRFLLIDLKDYLENSFLSPFIYLFQDPFFKWNKTFS